MDDFYRENILDHYRNPRNFGFLNKYDATWQESNLFCGDKIGMQVKLKIKDRIIDKISFYGEGCAISQAAASMLTEKVKGKSLREAGLLRVKDITNLLGVQLSPLRLKCALLPWEVLQKTLTLAIKK